MSETSGLPAASSFRIARGLKWLMALAAPVPAAAFAWLAWDMAQDRLAGRGWENAWLFALMLATLAALDVLFAAGLILVFRAKLEVSDEGLVLRGLFRTRTIPWKKVEGYRWVNGQMNGYLVGDEWPLNLAHFENKALLHAWFQSRVPDLHAEELAKEQREIREDHALGWMQDEKAAALGRLRRVVRPINWIAYAGAAIGGVNALFLEHEGVQLAAASVLIAASAALMLLALAYRDQVRLDYKEGSLYPEGLTGILASSLALGLMSLLDHHTLLGERFYQWTLPLAAASAGLWLYLEGERIRAQRRALFILLHVASIILLSGFWAGGSIYQINKHADVSEPVWGTTRVTGLRKSQEKTGTSYHVQVAPWSASPAEPVELDVSRETYDALHAGAAVAISVRSGALAMPWVDEVIPKR